MSDAVPAIGAIERLRLYYSRNEQRIAVLSFICGFLFDIVTVERADHWLAIVQQVVYIGVILAALTQIFFEEGGPPGVPTGLFFLKPCNSHSPPALVLFFYG